MSTISVPVHGTLRVVRGRETITRPASTFLFSVGMLLSITGELSQSPLWLSIGTLLGALAIVARAAGRLQQGGLSPAVLYAGAAAMTALGNAVAFASLGTPQQYSY